MYLLIEKYLDIFEYAAWKEIIFDDGLMTLSLENKKCCVIF